MSGITASVVRPPWKCPVCTHGNIHTVTRCQFRTFGPGAGRVTAVPAGVKLSDHLKTLGLRELPRVEVIQCPYVRPCDLCDRPGHPHSGGESRCDEHPLQEANAWTGKPSTRTTSASGEST